jgi:hypothetical protein
MSKKLSRLNKILQQNRNSILGIVQDLNVVPANSPEDSITLLLDEHFPDSRIINNDQSKGMSALRMETLGMPGSQPIIYVQRIPCGHVVRHHTPNLEVVGSSPAGSSNWICQWPLIVAWQRRG